MTDRAFNNSLERQQRISHDAVQAIRNVLENNVPTHYTKFSVLYGLQELANKAIEYVHILNNDITRLSPKERFEINEGFKVLVEDFLEVCKEDAKRVGRK